MWGLWKHTGVRRTTAIQPSAHLHSLCSHTTSPRQRRRRDLQVPSSHVTLLAVMDALSWCALSPYAQISDETTSFLQVAMAPLQGRKAQCRLQGSVKRWHNRSFASESLFQNLACTCTHLQRDMIAVAQLHSSATLYDHS
jgi:hypothetical protein